MSLTTPLALVLLLMAIPLLVYTGWPRNRFRRSRDIASLAIRSVIVLLLVMALAGLQVVRSTDRLAVVYLVDVSDSMSAEMQEAAFAYVRESLQSMRMDDEAGVVVFGRDAQIARSMSGSRDLGPIRAAPATGHTDIAAAVRLGLAMFPGDAARRMVILTDGLPTLGDSHRAAQLAAAAGVEISVVPFERPAAPEVLVQDVTVPPLLNENQLFDLTVTLQSQEQTEGIVTVFAAGEIILRQQLELRAGTSSYTLRLQSGAAGFRDFQVTVDPLEDDGFYQNNTLAAFSRVVGTPRVLVVGTPGDDEGLRHLVPALRENGLEVDLTTPGNLPLDVGGLAAYESVVLVNVSAVRLSNRRMEALERYVSELGGGLVVIGGPDAYGPGGYFQTPLEDALPVEAQIKDQQRLPQLTIAYLIDRSGSMGASVDGVPLIDQAKEAIIRSIDFLQPRDRAGIASFDQDSYWIAPFQEVLDRFQLQRLVATLRPGGGTSIMAGMQLVAQEIVNEPSDLKHIILLTDGGASPEGLVELTQRLNEDNNVTTSVISIGPSEARFLRQMALVGGGNYHYIADPSRIPTIFTVETVLASRTYIQEETFSPLLTANHPIMQGIVALPQLRGYVAAEPRAAAQIILRGPEPYHDPILAAWQYGLGRSVAFTSDATSRWGSNWVSWDDYATFWSQAVRWTMTEGTSSNLESRISMEDDQAHIVVDARADDGAFLNGLELIASVIHNTTRQGERVALRQVAPGRYEGSFTPEQEGAYFLLVTNQRQIDGPSHNQTTGWVMSYSPEYELRETDERLLETVTAMTGGSNLTGRPQDVYAHNITAHTASTPLAPWLLLVALLLLPFDIAVRRLLVTRGDLQRLRRAVFGEREQVASVPRLSTLREARDRARQRTGSAVEESPAPHPAATVGQLRRRREERTPDAPEITPPAAPASTSSVGPRYRRVEREIMPHELPFTERIPPKEGNIGARLLKKRRNDESDE